MREAPSHPRNVGGFTIIELLTIVALVGVLFAAAQPFIRGLLIEGRIPQTVADVVAVTQSMRAQAAQAMTSNPTPYALLGSPAQATATFANASRDKAQILTQTGVGAVATVHHSLGISGAAITVESSQVISPGDAFDVTFDGVNRAACPGLAIQMDRRVIATAVNGVQVKAVGATLNTVLASAQCADGDANVFAFTFQ